VRSRHLLTVAVTLVALVAPGCGGSRQFVADHRVHIESPRPRKLVTLPVTLRWRFDRFTVTGPDGTHRAGHGYFGVFVDRAPMPAGKDLRWLARNDRSCHATEGCPDTNYLALRDVHTATEPEIVFEQLPLPTFHKGTEDHSIAVVLLDGQGRRMGESAWYVDFRLRRKAHE